MWLHRIARHTLAAGLVGAGVLCVAGATPEEAEQVTGVAVEAIRETAREYARERHAAIFYTLGMTEHACGVDNIWSLSNLVALLRMNLFTHRDLWAWLDQPFEGPPTVLVTTQGELAIG